MSERETEREIDNTQTRREYIARLREEGQIGM